MSMREVDEQMLIIGTQVCNPKSTIEFLSCHDHDNLTRHVSFPTHRHCHALDHVITYANSTSSPTVISLPISPIDHFPIIRSWKILNSPTAHNNKISHSSYTTCCQHYQFPKHSLSRVIRLRIYHQRAMPLIVIMLPS